MLATALASVEDQHSGAPDNPQNWRVDGRMYPPQADQARPLAGEIDTTVYRSARHRTLIAANGALRIIDSISGQPYSRSRVLTVS